MARADLTHTFLALSLLCWTLTATFACPEGCSCSEERNHRGSRGSRRAPGNRGRLVSDAQRVMCTGVGLGETPEPSTLPKYTIALILSSNHISRLRNASFYSLSSLQRLDLKSNLISTVEAGAFLGLTKLRKLDLSNNRLGCMNKDTFEGLPNLTRLNLSGNIFTTITEGTFDNLVSLRFLDFASDVLVCDCGLEWLPASMRSRPRVRLSDRTRCAHPRVLYGLPLSNIREGQLTCETPMELPIFQLLPSSAQLIFTGDKLPLQCAASLVGGGTSLTWRHNGRTVGRQAEALGILLEPMKVHDCSVVTSGVVITAVIPELKGYWECVASASERNASRGVELIVLESSALHCPEDRVINSQEEFRWPQSPAGTTATSPCPMLMWHTSSAGLKRLPSLTETTRNPNNFPKAKRWCKHSGIWGDGDYSSCQYSHERTGLLHTYAQVPMNGSTVLGLGRRLSAQLHTTAVTNGMSSAELLLAAGLLERLTDFANGSHEVGELLLEMTSLLMQADKLALQEAQQEARAASRIAASVLRFARSALHGDAQHFSKFSSNVALTAVRFRTASFVGITCTAYRRLEIPETWHRGPRPLHPPPTGPSSDKLLHFKCNTGNLSNSLMHFPVKNTVAEASVQLPPSLFARGGTEPAPDASGLLQIIVFANGNLFPSPAGSLADTVGHHGPRVAVATPVVYVNVDGLGALNISEPVLIWFRRMIPAPDLAPALWDASAAAGQGAWRPNGCSLHNLKPRTAGLACRRLGTYALLVDARGSWSTQKPPVSPPQHPFVYAGSSVLILCLLILITSYLLHRKSVQVSRAVWHALVNMWAHQALTAAAYVSGVNQTSPAVLCQAVTIVLHYASLSSLLWLVIYSRQIGKRMAHRPPAPLSTESPSSPPRPILRFYLIGGGIPLVICGITAAANVGDHGSPCCWLAWEPSLAAFFGPAAFAALATLAYLTLGLVRLCCHHRSQQESAGRTTTTEGPKEEIWDDELSPSAQLLAAACTLIACGAAGTFGGLAAARGGLTYAGLTSMWAAALGLGSLLHHGLRRKDVRRCWGCRTKRAAEASATHGQVNTTARSGSSTDWSGAMKLTNLQVAQNRGLETSRSLPGLCPTGGSGERLSTTEPSVNGEAISCERESTWSNGQIVRPKTWGRSGGGTSAAISAQARLAALRGYAYDVPTSLDGSGHEDSETHVQRNGPNKFITQLPSDEDSMQTSKEEAENVSICGAMTRRGQSMELAAVSQGTHSTRDTGSEAELARAESKASIRTGPWKNETTV
uniref:Adhesion G protein-coupled receptor A2 n=1 Tax=Eptatretus burgeri TaxID=7764 RepID=A0A8C4R7R7_EPTBU